MKIRNSQCFSLFLMGAAAFMAGSASRAQVVAPKKPEPRAEIALQYDYVRSNTQPGCACFDLNGGSATFAWRLAPVPVALVGDVSVTHSSGVSNGNYSLTLSTYTAGARYLPRVRFPLLKPFGEILVGISHSSGSLVQGLSSASNSGAAFAANVGGGLDLRAGKRFSIRVIEADYLLTTFDNGTNNHQNNLRLSAGGVLHF